MNENEQAFANGYSAGYEAGRRSAGYTKWVQTTERMPEHGDIVLCFMKFKEIKILQWDERSVLWVGDFDDFKKEAVIHWMPLPTPPQKKEG